MIVHLITVEVECGSLEFKGKGIAGGGGVDGCSTVKEGVLVSRPLSGVGDEGGRVVEGRIRQGRSVWDKKYSRSVLRPLGESAEQGRIRTVPLSTKLQTLHYYQIKSDIPPQNLEHRLVFRISEIIRLVQNYPVISRRG
jgi:hypothetical protein